MFNLLKTRKGKLFDNLEKELNNNPNIESILKIIDEYEYANLETIKKLKRDKVVYLNKISGALKQTINAHGPITKQFISSATKRIYGALLSEKKPNLLKRLLNKIR
jgi:hypothetical protein